MALKDRLKIMHEERNTQVRYLRITPLLSGGCRLGVTAEDLYEVFGGYVGSGYVLKSADKGDDGSWEFALEMTDFTMKPVEP
ncbi:hypothetical protein Wildcat_129 [Mycobacterium phage Wildcat]|uniref:Uncharacterized protein n=2 Tax=Mycobacterium virus Wildcat TaxID=1993859 RepID=Q19XV5_9CAUD|nr:hypothetical protein Wildcat_129 [Mycobacterium phage Wildcat]ABE67709.1 hypothetical protein Wildcat_129 [Mycobacterium phage Wildcat]QGJ89993.1 hypothetical protein PBI_MARYV_116 [Mycobacterium phage MaryV]